MVEGLKARGREVTTGFVFEEKLTLVVDSLDEEVVKERREEKEEEEERERDGVRLVVEEEEEEREREGRERK